LAVSSAEKQQLPFPKFVLEVISAQSERLEKSLAVPDTTAQLCQKRKLSVLLDTGVWAALLNTENAWLVLIAKKEVPSQHLAHLATTDLEIRTTSTLHPVARNAVEVSTQT
jgi:hypothetical protein